MKITIKTSVLDFSFENDQVSHAQHLEDSRNVDAQLKFIKDCIDKVVSETIKIKQA